MANEYYLEHAMYLIGIGEGSVQWSANGYVVMYDVVEKGEPNEGIGLMQWTWGRSFDILRDIYIALGNNWGGTTPPNDIKNAIENNQRWSSYKWWYGTASVTWVKQFLVLETAKEVQINKYRDEIQGYLDQMESQGITDLRARIFCADVTNQYGGGWGNVFGGARYNSNHNSLDSAWNFTPTTYYNRRKYAYDYLKTADFSSPPPVHFPSASSVPSTPEADGNIAPQEPPKKQDDPEIIEEAMKKQKVGMLYPNNNGTFYFNKAFKLTKKLQGYELTPLVDLKDLDLSILDKVVKEKEEEEQKRVEENAGNKIEEIETSGTTNASIDKVVAKANSYTDHSVLYSMTGARDMITSGDCSCFVRICFDEVGISLGGYTGAQFQTCKNLGAVILHGGRDIIPQMVARAKKGDIVLMSTADPNFGAGGDSHVGVMIDNETLRHQAYRYPPDTWFYGPGNTNLNYYASNWLTMYYHWALCRPIK